MVETEGIRFGHRPVIVILYCVAVAVLDQLDGVGDIDGHQSPADVGEALSSQIDDRNR